MDVEMAVFDFAANGARLPLRTLSLCGGLDLTAILAWTTRSPLEVNTGQLKTQRQSIGLPRSESRCPNNLMNGSQVPKTLVESPGGHTWRNGPTPDPPWDWYL